VIGSVTVRDGTITQQSARRTGPLEKYVVGVLFLFYKFFGKKREFPQKLSKKPGKVRASYISHCTGTHTPSRGPVRREFLGCVYSETMSKYVGFTRKFHEYTHTEGYVVKYSGSPVGLPQLHFLRPY